MGLIIGPTTWWANELAAACPAGSGSSLLVDGSRTFCKAGGVAWIVAPSSTEVFSTWAGGLYGFNSSVGSKSSISDWPGLCTQLFSCGFNPCDWFVPSSSQMLSLYNCRSSLDNFNTGNPCYHTSTENSTNRDANVNMTTGSTGGDVYKATNIPVRAIRCVTY